MSKILRAGFFLVFGFVIQWSNAQTLTVNASQLNFGNAFENAPDSLQLTITNTLGRTVTIFGIKFYETYGSSAFSASSTFFSIADGGSSTIWIKFSPKHNIFHNSELVIENDGLRGYMSVDLQGQGKYSDTYYNLTENLSEQNLKNVINAITGNGYVSLGYNIGRDSMFMSIDNKKRNGQGASQNTIECIYTGREAVGYTDRSDCQTSFSFNTEHTLPQSLFLSAEPMKSDLHHLFPTDDAANNERGDNPFGVVSNPTWTNGGSKSNGTIFEPRDAQKGATARALFYFVLRYQNYSNFLNSQEAILRTWHHNFPPTSIERKRNSDINLIQHNKNPFVDYPVFLDRITSVSSNSVAPLVSTIDLTQDTIVYGTIQPATPVIFNYLIVNTGNTDIHFTNFSLTHPTELSFASTGNDTTIAPGEALPVQIRCLTTLTDSIRAFLTFNSDASGHSSVSIPIFVNDLVVTSVPQIFSDVNISPNPAHDRLNISFGNGSWEFQWTIFNVTGQKIQADSERNSKETTIDLHSMKPGIYLLRIETQQGVFNKRIVVE